MSRPSRVLQNKDFPGSFHHICRSIIALHACHFSHPCQNLFSAAAAVALVKAFLESTPRALVYKVGIRTTEPVLSCYSEQQKTTYVFWPFLAAYHPRYLLISNSTIVFASEAPDVCTPGIETTLHKSQGPNMLLRRPNRSSQAWTVNSSERRDKLEETEAVQYWISTK